MPATRSSLMLYQPPLTPVSEAESDTTETTSVSGTPPSSSSAASTDGSSVITAFKFAQSPPNHKRPLNFSRPRPVDFSPAHRVHHDRSDSFNGSLLSTDTSPTRSAHIFNAFDLRTRERSTSLPLPDELSFSTAEKETALDDGDSSTADVKSIVDAAGLNDGFWDTHLQHMKPLRQFGFEAQRSQPRLLYGPKAASKASNSIAPVELPGSVPEVGSIFRRPSLSSRAVTAPAYALTTTNRPSTAPSIATARPSIPLRTASATAGVRPTTRRPSTAPTGSTSRSSLVPRTAPAATFGRETPRPAVVAAPKTPPQIIEREPGEDEWDGEDARSHHTVSEMGEDDSLQAQLQQQEQKSISSGDSMSSWSSSNHDVGSLTEGQIKKLRKKGINPALYAEMKAARRGKGKWINPLVGNTYLS